MVDKDTHGEKRTLADQLRFEAHRTRPAFSESLHARICRSVGQSEMAPPPRPAPRRRAGAVLIAAAVAASLAVAVLCWAWLRHGDRGPVPDPRHLVLPTPQEKRIIKPEPGPDEDLQSPGEVPNNPAVDFSLLVDSTLVNRRWAYLDHDARLAARMLLDQLPPSIAWPEEEP